MTREDKLLLCGALALGGLAMGLDVAFGRAWNVEASLGMLMFVMGSYVFARA